MTNRSKKKPSSSAEITPTGGYSLTQLKNSARKALRPSGKKGDLINGLAAIQVETLNSLGCFSLDEPIIDDSQDQEIVILDRGNSPNLSAVPRQDTAAPRQDTAASQEDTATLVETSSLSNLSAKSLQQTAIINFSSIPHTHFEITPVQQPIKTIFLDNIAPPFFRAPLPEPNKRFNSTLQLAFGRHILLTNSVSTVEDDIQAIGLEGTDWLWMSTISKDPIEQGRLPWLIAQIVFQFLKSDHKDAMSIAEVTLLGPVLDHQDYRSVLSSLIRQLDQEPVLDPELLRGFVYFLQSTSPGYLIDDDLVRILRVLRSRLKGTHMQLSDASALKHIYLLVIAVSRVLDMMVEGNVKGLNRTEDHRPLLGVLAGLKDSPHLYLKYQAMYAWQALQYIGDDESPLNMALRVGGGLVMAGLGVASASKLDIKGLFDGLCELSKAAEQVLDATKTAIESAQTARDAGEGVMDSLLKGFRTGNKQVWYPALQGASVLIREGRLADFKRVVYEAPCRHKQEFQWGVCQLLGEMAMDPIWGTEICQQAVYLLEDLHRKDSGWTKDSGVREAIRGILLRISKSTKKTSSIHVNSLSRDSRWDNGDDSAEPYPLITRLPTPESSLLLTKVLKIPSLEYNLHRIMAQRLEEHQQAVYIPPHAKTNLETSDDEYFPLMDKVIEFLKSDDGQVFLILGNSGSGKSTFTRHLDYVLKKDYNQDSPIPIFIYLPTVKSPGTLISEHLKILNFTDDDILELKRDRRFIVICDSYDESRLSINLHTSNMLNRPGQWNAKMIISCRSSHRCLKCPELFRPQPPERYLQETPDLFQEAVIIPFSSSQIEDYVKQFVRDKEVRKLSPDRLIWSTAEYMDKLTRIPNLLPLVKNPFLLSLSLRSLPVVLKDDLDPSTITITRPKLFGIFIDEWLEVNRKRLTSMVLSEAAKAKLDELVEGGFKRIAIKFLRNLAEAIYKEQAGNPVIQYVHYYDKETWKAKFFGPDEDITLLRQSSPLIQVENLHSFIHRSLLEYFCSLQMATLISPTNKRENGQHEHIPGILQTNNPQTDLSQEHPTPNDQCKQGNLSSPSLSEKAHNRMSLSIPNASDPGSSFSSPNFPSNTFKGTTLRDACDDTTSGTEFDGSVSSDDEFEDAHEFISSDPPERITQSAPILKPTMPETFVEEKGKTIKGIIIKKETSSVSEPIVSKGPSWFSRVVTSTKKGGNAAADAVAKAGSTAGDIASGTLRRVDGVWTRTVQILTTRKARVDEVCPIAKTSYVYYDDDVYDAVLTEKETGITYVTQLLYDTDTKAYYVYYRHGDTDYKLNGPHKTIKDAKDAFQINYKDKFDTDWTQRETVSERWTYEIKTYETFEEVEEIEEVVDESEVEIIAVRENEIAEDSTTITTETTTTTITQEEVVEKPTMPETVVEEKGETTKEIITKKETSSVSEPIVSKGPSWFSRVVTSTKDAVQSAGSAASGAVTNAGSAVGGVASGALRQVDGVWTRTIQILTTRKAHVDEGCPIAKTSYVYYDDDVYDAVLTEKETGITYVTQLLYDTDIKAYYVYYRHGDTDYKLDGPHETIEAAKDAFQVTYKEKFDVDWSQRETTVSEHWTYETKIYTTFEEVEEIEEVVDETEIEVITREQQSPISDTTKQTKTITIQDGANIESAKKTVVAKIQEETETVDVTTTVDQVVENVAINEGIEKVVVSTSTDIIAKPAASKESWFRKITSKAAGGANAAADGALKMIDGVWRRTVPVITTRKADVDGVCPIAKTSYVYYNDDDVYDATVVESSTGVTYRTQLIYNTETKVYCVYYRYGETDYKLDGPHETIEVAKNAFQKNYKERFDIEWTQRETTVSERYTYIITTYETIEEIEYVEEIVEKEEAESIIARENLDVVYDDDNNATVHTEVVETTTTTTTTTNEVPAAIDHVTSQVIEKKEGVVEVEQDTRRIEVIETTTTDEETSTVEHITTQVIKEKEDIVEVERDTRSQDVGVSGRSTLVSTEVIETTTTNEVPTTTEHVTTQVIEEKESVAAKPVVSKGSSWFTRVVSKSEAATIALAATAAAVGGIAASGAGDVASGALRKIDGVWRRTVPVVIARKAPVDEICDIAKTSYVYYDDDVYDATVVENSTRVTYKTQLIYNTETKVYYVYCRYGETDYKLDGPHETIEVAKNAFQKNYKERFDIEWTQRETTVSERYTYIITTYETIEEIEYVEEIVETDEAERIITCENLDVVYDDDNNATIHTEVVETTTTTTTNEGPAAIDHVTSQVIEKKEGVVELEKDTCSTKIIGAITTEEETSTLDENTTIKVIEEKEVIVEIGQDTRSHDVVVSGSTTAFHTEKDVIVNNQADIDADVEASVVDIEKVKVDAEVEVSTRADTEVEVSVEVDAKVVDDDEVKEEVVVDVEVAPSPSLPKYMISGIPASLGDLTAESLVSEMSASPVFNDQSLGAMDLEEEPDILQFLVDRVHEDPDYTKLLLWTVYKSGAEGIVNQSTKNAMRILEMAGIRFQLQV